MSIRGHFKIVFTKLLQMMMLLFYVSMNIVIMVSTTIIVLREGSGLTVRIQNIRYQKLA